MRSRFIYRLFLFCCGLFLASAFAMKWIEKDLVFNGETISIIGLELYYPKEKITGIFTGLDSSIRTILSYHLHFDFIFMAGIYPAIACLCLMVAGKLKNRAVRNILKVLAFLQPAACIFDIIENYYLLNWLRHPVIGNEFGFFHAVVYMKWALALTGVLFAVLTWIFYQINIRNLPARWR